MAKMFPTDLREFIPNKSEKIFFEEIKKQLPDKFYVFYSVRWFKLNNGLREDSECDFLVIDPNFGFLTIEVKGGQGIKKEGRKWMLKMGNQEDEEYSILKKSPFFQAEQSMRFFKEYFEDEYKDRFPGIFGFACAFPNFNTLKNLGPEAPSELIIDFKDMKNLQERINEIFHYWKGKRRGFVFFSPEAKKKLVSIVNKRIALSAVAGALIEEQKRKLEIENIKQENYLDFISNYKQAYIVGGAGTGKTWMAIKKAKNLAKEGKKVLIICYNSQLMKFIRKMISGYDKIYCFSFWGLASKELPKQIFKELSKNNELEGVFEKMDEMKLEKYDAVIIDEGQDFNDEWALTTRLFLKDESSSILYVFYDLNQNIFQRDFKDAFGIDNPPFALVENIRNSAAIHNWTVSATGIGKGIRASSIYGVEPEVHSFSQARKGRKELAIILNKLVKKEGVSNTSIIILSNRLIENSFLRGRTEIGEFNLVFEEKELKENEVYYRTVQGFKGLEADVVVYIHHGPGSFHTENKEQLYVAYTRARFYLFVLEYQGD